MANDGLSGIHEAFVAQVAAILQVHDANFIVSDYQRDTTIFETAGGRAHRVALMGDPVRYCEVVPYSNPLPDGAQELLADGTIDEFRYFIQIRLWYEYADAALYKDSSAWQWMELLTSHNELKPGLLKELNRLKLTTQSLLVDESGDYVIDDAGDRIILYGTDHVWVDDVSSGRFDFIFPLDSDNRERAHYAEFLVQVI